MKFKYYKLGQGELDTSNFDEIVENGWVSIERLGSKEFVSLLALNQYILENDYMSVQCFVQGYVYHMRSDKDLFNVSSLYRKLLPNINFKCRSIQHESNSKIKSGKLAWFTVYGKSVSTFPELINKDDLLIVNADKSVKKFRNTFPNTKTLECDKVRENGKVISMDVPTHTQTSNMKYIIIDDLIGGGATITMIIAKLLTDYDVYPENIYLWVRYNEGIHNVSDFSNFGIPLENLHFGEEI